MYNYLDPRRSRETRYVPDIARPCVPQSIYGRYIRHIYTCPDIRIGYTGHRIYCTYIRCRIYVTGYTVHRIYCTYIRYTCHRNYTRYGHVSNAKVLGVHTDYILSLNHNFPAQNIFTSIYVQYIRATGYSPPGIVMSCDVLLLLLLLLLPPIFL
jgi:hypothetical protein